MEIKIKWPVHGILDAIIISLVFFYFIILSSCDFNSFSINDALFIFLLTALVFCVSMYYITMIIISTSNNNHAHEDLEFNEVAIENIKSEFNIVI